MTQYVLLKHQYTGSLPDAPDNNSRLMCDENGNLLLIDQDRVEKMYPSLSADGKSLVGAGGGAVWCLVWAGTQAQYDAIAVKSATVLYVIV